MLQITLQILSTVMQGFYWGGGQDDPASFVSSLLVFHPLASINLLPPPHLVTPVSPLLLLSVTGWIGSITALDYMTVCRPKSFLYVCTQQTVGVRGGGGFHSSSSPHTHTSKHVLTQTHTHTRTHTPAATPSSLVSTHTFIIIINTSDVNTINPIHFPFT